MVLPILALSSAHPPKKQFHTIFPLWFLLSAEDFNSFRTDLSTKYTRQRSYPMHFAFCLLLGQTLHFVPVPFPSPPQNFISTPGSSFHPFFNGSFPRGKYTIIFPFKRSLVISFSLLPIHRKSACKLSMLSVYFCPLFLSIQHSSAWVSFVLNMPPIFWAVPYHRRNLQKSHQFHDSTHLWIQRKCHTIRLK